MSRARLYVLVPALAVLGCRSPTEITIAIATDLDCSARLVTSISDGVPDDIARVPPATTTTQCAGAGDIGTLVFVPSHARDDRLAVQVVTAIGVPLESCNPPVFGKDCIVATRSLRYIAHTSLTLPIVMRNTCRGVVCPDGQTCSNGACTSAEIDPSTCIEPAGCAEPAPPIDASAPRPIDAGIVGHAGTYWTEAGDYSMANGGI